MDTRRLLFWVNIFLVVAIVMSAIVLVSNIKLGSSTPDQTPKGSISNIVVSGRTSVKIVLGNCTSPVSMTDCVVQLTSPDGEVSRTPIEKNVLTYTKLPSVTGLTSVELSSTGEITDGTYIVIKNYMILQLGSWSLKLIYEPTDGYLIERAIIVPDIANAPTGYFSDYQAVSVSEERLIIGIVTPATAPSSCQIVVRAPNSTEVTFNLTSQTTTSYTLADGTVVKYVDQGTDGIINVNDYISITSHTTLKQGQWTVRILYDYTGESFASIIFQVGSVV